MPQDLCRIGDVRRRLGTALATSFDDERLRLLLDGEDDATGIIEEKSAAFETRVGRVFESATGTVALSGNGTNYLFIPTEYTPIISIASISEGGGDLEDTAWVVDDADAGIVLKGGTADASYDTRLGAPRWSIGVGNVSVTLTHGWATIPVDVRGAVADMCALELLRMDADERGGDLTSRRLGDRQESYSAGGGGLHGGTIKRLEGEVERVVTLYGGRVDV